MQVDIIRTVVLFYIICLIYLKIRSQQVNKTKESCSQFSLQLIKSKERSDSEILVKTKTMGKMKKNPASGRYDYIFKSFKYIDAEPDKGLSIAVTYGTRDYGYRYVGRLMYISDGNVKASNIIVITRTLTGMRRDLKKYYPAAIAIPRSPSDDPVVIETWIL